MKWERLICLLLLWPGILLAQSSPAPSITNYAGSALSDSLALDSVFCKGAIVAVAGTNFKRAMGGESWDTTRVFLGGFGGFLAEVSEISTSGGGNNDTLVFQLPDIFLADTCIGMTIVKTTLAGGTPFSYSVTDTICLRGDYARVTYPDTLYCLGDSNPIPQIVLGPNTTGGFCCPVGASGFVVLPSGEVPVYPGAVGANNRFQYQTNHPQCGDTLIFEFDILQLTPTHATYNGLTNVLLCKSTTSILEADTVNLVPPRGMGHFANPFGGLVVLDSLTGRLDIQNSQAGTHQLLYIPHLPCYDTALVTITVNAPASAQIIYPAIGPNNLLCQSALTANPAFISGSPGGQFWSVPGGITFGQLGEIIPASSQPGTYSIFYLPPGNCADTVAVLSGLVIDSIVSATLGFSSLIVCLGDSLALDTLSGGLIDLSFSGSSLYSGNPARLALSGFGLNGGETLTLQYVRAGNCPDTATASISVLPTDDPSFSYPNPAYCLGDPDPYPVITGLGGGTFSAITTGTIVSVFGQLDLTGSGQGQHDIQYTTAGPCPASDTVTVFIYNAASAQFSYPASVFCMGEADPLPTIQGAPGGVFTADSGLVVDGTTGAIGIAGSGPGTYNVTYTLSGGCNTSFSQTVQIVGFDSTTSIRYREGDFCREGSDPRPAILGDSVGTFFGSAGVVFSNRDSGTVDLSATGPGGPFVITLDLDNRCAADPMDTIYILGTDDANFSYSITETCEDGAPLEVVMVSAPGGVFSSPSSALVFTGSLGTIDLVASTPGGPYTIEYLTSGPCPATSSQSLSILPKPSGVELRAFPDGTICEDEQISLQAITGSAVSEYRFYVNGTPTPGVFDLLQSDSFRDGDSISCILENSAGCTDTLSRKLLIAPRPHVQILSYQRTVSRGEPVRVNLGAFVHGTVYDWLATGIGAIEIPSPSASTLPVLRGEETEVEIRFRLTTPTDPARIRLELTPRAGDCPGGADTVLIEVLPSDFPVMVPEVMTPNDDGFNDTWQVHWRSEVRPEDYTLKLFNRAGGRVMRMHPIHNRFTGENLPDGVYWWKLEDHSGTAVQVGGLTIRRK